MPGPSIASQVVENIAQELLQKSSVSDVCRKFKISRPTVTSIKKGQHKSLSSLTRNKLVLMSKSKGKTTPSKKQSVPTPRENDDFDHIKIAQENMRLRNSLHEINQKITKIFNQIGDFDGGKACA